MRQEGHTGNPGGVLCLLRGLLQEVNGERGLHEVCSDLAWVLNIELPLPDSYNQGFSEHSPLAAWSRDSAPDKGNQHHQKTEIKGICDNVGCGQMNLEGIKKWGF